MTGSLVSKRERLLAWFQGRGSCAVAFSAGVDSAVVAQAARLALGDQAIAVTGVSPSLAEGELDQARQVARQIGIRHLEISTHEVSLPQYIRNDAQRCFHCKHELYTLVQRATAELGVQCVVNGTNLDDLGDYRPGLQAAAEHQVLSPLAECQISKQETRQLARHWGLPVWDKPATPCLSSRIAYGEEVTEERLRMIDRAEQFLKQRGFATCRVRYHRGDLARIEVPEDSVALLADGELRSALTAYLKNLGFRYVSLDLEGFRSGSLNQLVQIGRAGAADE